MAIKENQPKCLPVLPLCHRGLKPLGLGHRSTLTADASEPGPTRRRKDKDPE
jgi:hypothetical protein